MNRAQRIAELHHQIRRRKPAWTWGQADRAAQWLTKTGPWQLHPDPHWEHPDIDTRAAIDKWRGRS